MCEILWNPLKTKKDASIERSATLMVGEAVILAVATGIAMAKTQMFIAGTSAIAVFVAVIFGVLYFAIVLKGVIKALLNKGEYQHALAVVTNSLLAISIGILIASILTYVPVIGIGLAYLVFVPFAGLSYAVMFKLIKNLYGTDMITSFVTVTILWTVIILSIYVIFALNIANLQMLSTVGLKSF